MEGNLYIGDDIDDFDIAERAAIDSGDTARFYLSANAWDTNTCKPTAWKFSKSEIR